MTGQVKSLAMMLELRGVDSGDEVEIDRIEVDDIKI